MAKKAQVTVFIILGIIIVATVIGFFILRDSAAKKELSEQKEVIQTGNVKAFVENCLEQTGEDGLNLIGSQGGYNKLLNKNILLAGTSLLISSCLTYKTIPQNSDSYFLLNLFSFFGFPP